jgi:hypothetical protein
MKQALNIKGPTNCQIVRPFRHSRIHKPRGATMMTVLRLFLLMTLIGLMGCDTHYEYVWEEGAHQVQTPKVEQVDQTPQPVATLVSFVSSKSKEEEPLADPVPAAKSQKLAPTPKSSSFGSYLTLNSKPYLSKAGELMADLTIGNNNFVSVNQITVQCVEYNMNHASVRKASITLVNTLQVGESGYYDQVNFGYVHNDFETVQCTIEDAKLS